MREFVRKVLVTSELRGHVDRLRRFVGKAAEVGAQAVAVVGSLAPKAATARTYSEVFRTLAEARLPTFYVPGPEDAPVWEALREAANIEVVFPYLHGVHGTIAFAPGQVVFAGIGGAVVDDPDATPEWREALRVPGWLAEYQMKVLAELKDYQKVFLFATPPRHKGVHEDGSAVLAELVKTYRPRAVVVAGGPPRYWELGRSAVAVAGRLAEGEFGVLDLTTGTLEAGRLD